MASGYVTSDGKDLDSRYLAIGGKAASASYADRAGNLGGAGRVVRNGNPVQFSITGSNSYTVRSDGIVTNNSSGATTPAGIAVNGQCAGKTVFVQSGDQITIPSNGSYTKQFVLYPMKVN